MFLYLHHTPSYLLLHSSFISTLLMRCFFFCSLYHLFILIPISPPAPVCCDHPGCLHFVKFLISFDPFFPSQTLALLFCCPRALQIHFWIWITKLVRHWKNNKNSRHVLVAKKLEKIIPDHLKWNDAVQSFLSELMYSAYQYESICLCYLK